MTTPPQRPGDPGWRGRVPPPDPATQRIPRQGRPPGPTDRIPPGPTERIPAARRPGVDAPTEKIRQPPPPPFTPATAEQQPPGDKPRKSSLRSPKAIVLIVVTIVALVFGALAAAELIARWRAASILTTASSCLVQDTTDVSFSTTPPFLYQYFTGDYTDISVTTAGNQIRQAKGLKAEVTLQDIRLEESADSKGTIGNLTATLSWTTDGIKETIGEAIKDLPLLSSAEVTAVSTDASAGTITFDLKAEILGNETTIDITAKPTVVDGALSLTIVDGGLIADAAQSALDALAKKANDSYPLGIKADSIQVTDNAVVGDFSAQNASIPSGDSDPDDCFGDL